MKGILTSCEYILGQFIDEAPHFIRVTERQIFRPCGLGGRAVPLCQSAVRDYMIEMLNMAKDFNGRLSLRGRGFIRQILGPRAHRLEKITRTSFGSPKG